MKFYNIDVEHENTETCPLYGNTEFYNIYVYTWILINNNLTGILLLLKASVKASRL